MSKRKATTTQKQEAPAHQLVEAARLHHGDPEGDIVGSYSGDRISEGKPIRKPFSWQGGRYVCVSMWGKLASAYRLIPLASSAVTPTSYSEVSHLGDVSRNNPNGFYHGVVVKHAGSAYVMTGPKVTFAPGDVGQAQLPVTGEADVEREAKLDAERVTLEYRQRSQKRADSGRLPISESPLFGGRAQGNLFGEE